MNTDFFKKIDDIHTLKLPFVVYRKPGDEIITGMFQHTDELHNLNSFNESGFVFAPFSKKGDHLFFPIEKCTGFEVHLNPDELLIDESDLSNFENVIPVDQLKERHISLVQKGIDCIKRNQAEKIVLSREEKVKFQHFDIVRSLKKMLRNYRNSFVYVWFHPLVGLWMGASPEKLLQMENSNFKTMSLAGTQTFKGTKNVAWQPKEKQEQLFVTDFILEQLKPTASSLNVTGPYTVQAGNLLHLRSDISGKLRSKGMLKDLVDLLHPTPAVCGLPIKKATKFILDYEGYDRSYYSGYMGELNMCETTNLFVNLRCMQLTHDSATIYVGGGITKDSDAEKEWDETVSKAKVMKRVL